MPPEYLDLYLCRDVYHCPPDALDRQDPLRILTHLTCLSIEGQADRLRRSKNQL